MYWATTGIVALMMLFSAYSYLTNPEMIKAFPQHMGFPGYFRVELAIAKIIGVAALLLPLSPTVKEWAYAGFTITFVSAFIAHSAIADPIGARVFPILFLILLGLSYSSYKKLSL